ncbi:cystinosin [Polychaeton citri CBS 116435]|uniref:Cystinosin n=1 Tax=Polychaeton citri CBS 116435 TaxID=1314669 RepID=A0A9P4QDI2_9PEZI|nr:cystinosin [Polychaeton citri CBS 116435]
MASKYAESMLPIISQCCGWLYFLLWSISFYPQPVLNFKRRSTSGLTFDYPLLNMFGFVCYTAGTAIFLYSSTVRSEYAARHPLSPEPTVRFNDLCFGLNAVVLCTSTVSQFWPSIWGWKSESSRHASRVTLCVLFGGILGIVMSLIFVVASSKEFDDTVTKWRWIDVAYALTYVKLLVTVFKYIPQIIANHFRRSTVGWSINQVLLDFGGSILSFLQLIIDSALQSSWEGLAGNPVKMGLANISLLADVIFMLQHFVFYRQRDYDTEESSWIDPECAQETESDPLLQR